MLANIHRPWSDSTHVPCISSDPAVAFHAPGLRPRISNDPIILFCLFIWTITNDNLKKNQKSCKFSWIQSSHQCMVNYGGTSWIREHAFLIIHKILGDMKTDNDRLLGDKCFQFILIAIKITLAIIRNIHDWRILASLANLTEGCLFVLFAIRHTEILSILQCFSWPENIIFYHVNDDYSKSLTIRLQKIKWDEDSTLKLLSLAITSERASITIDNILLRSEKSFFQ